MVDSVKAYGFEYAYKGERQTFRVLAHSETEAMEKHAAMAACKFAGELQSPDAGDTTWRVV